MSILETKLSEHFILSDLVPKDIVMEDLEYSIRYIDQRVLDALEQVVKFFGVKPIVNNYASGGSLSYRGFRPPSYDDGAKNSMHRYGKAADISIPGKTDSSVRRTILDNRVKFPDIRRMEENTTGWVHIDVKVTGQNGIVMFPNPNFK